MEIIEGDKKNTIFFLLFLSLILIATYLTYRRTIILHDYPIVMDEEVVGTNEHEANPE